MMNFLFSDEWVAKLRKIPKFVWYLLMALTFFFADMYTILDECISSASILNETVAEMGVSVNFTGFSVIFVLFNAFLSELIFEIINNVAAGIMIARFSAHISREDFRFRLRLSYFYANIVIGFFGIIYFFTQTKNGVYTGIPSFFTGTSGTDVYANDVYLIMASIIPFTVYSLNLIYFYNDFQKNYLPKRNVTRAFSFVARIYFGVALLFEIVQIVSNLFLYEQSFTPCEYATYWVSFGVTVLCTIGAYCYYLLRLKKVKDDDDNQGPTFTVLTKEDTQHNIYDDFGF